MNNEQFRKLMLAKSGPTSKDGASPKGTSPGANTGSLGSRQRNSIPMTPYVVASFAIDGILLTRIMKDDL